MARVDVEIKGLKETQRRLEKALQEISAGGGLEAIIAKATLRAHRYATSITHVDTGRLKNSHFPSIQTKGNEVYGVVGNNTAYAMFEHERGGSHAFYDRTMKEEGPNIVAGIEMDIAKIAREANG